MDLKELKSGVNPNTHWYYQTKKIRLRKFFEEKVVSPRRKVTVIDIGAGSGFFSQEIYRCYPKHIEQILLVDLYHSDEEIDQTMDKFIRKMRELPPIIENSFVIMMDVLEHIKDDDKFLCELKNRIKSRNHFFVTVPAFQQLWSGHDVFLGHFRRYTLKQIDKLLRECGFSIQNRYYQYGFIFPLVYLLRGLGNKSTEPRNDMKPVNSIINLILQTVLSLEMKFARFNQWFGLTCTVEGYVEEDQESLVLR
jgi:hypothetical protein